MKKADAMLEEFKPDKTPPSVVLGYFLSLVAGLVGGMSGGYVGWMYDDGIVPVVAGLCGFAVFFSVVFMVSGPGYFHFSQLYLELKPPEWIGSKRWASKRLTSTSRFIACKTCTMATTWSGSSTLKAVADFSWRSRLAACSIQRRNTGSSA